MAQKAPGKAHREGISLIELTEMFPDDESAVRWFEGIRWPNGRHCGHCGSVETKEVPNAKPMPYWCKDCRSYFSVRTGTAIENSRLPLRKWAFAIYLNVTNLKSVSSMKLHRDLKVTQKTAWFMQHRLREAWSNELDEPMAGPVEVDETHMGGLERNKHSKDKLRAGRGAVGKTTVAGAKDRTTGNISAAVVDSTAKATLHRFVKDRVAPGAKVYTDEAGGYQGLPFDHETVCHGVGEYVREMAHTNGIESFWATLKRAHKGTFHKMSPKHLQRYVDEFAGKHGIRDADTIDQMQAMVAGMVGKRLLYRELIAS